MVYRFIYGYNILHTLPLSEIVLYLHWSEDLEMKTFKEAVVSSLLNKVTEANICEALHDPICLNTSTTEPHFKTVNIFDFLYCKFISCNYVSRLIVDAPL